MSADIMQDIKCKQGEGVGRSSVAGHFIKYNHRRRIKWDVEIFVCRDVFIIRSRNSQRLIERIEMQLLNCNCINLAHKAVWISFILCFSGAPLCKLMFN